MPRLTIVLALASLIPGVPRAAQPSSVTAPQTLSISNAGGLELRVASDVTQPLLRIRLPGLVADDRSIHVLFPEHVTVVKVGSTTAEQLYLYRPDSESEKPVWRRTESALEYEREFRGGIRLIARATLEDDGVRFRYEFTNAGTDAYTMITAVTDPRLTGIFHDVRLERTYVHHAEGFDLLASEVPGRLTMPLDRWLPARVLASFTWPVPAERVEPRGGGLTHYNKSRKVDVPFIATMSAEHTWVIASFAREAGNVWSNPELTCQHVDPQMPLAKGQRAAFDVKMLILRGSLEDAFARATQQRAAMR